MDWMTFLIFVGVLALYFGLKRLGLVRVETARVSLEKGAKVIDVRSPGEYQAGHLDGTVNIPLHELRNQISSQVPDKEQVLLLHCLSGTRSALAKRILRQLGYRQVHNLGSYRRAQRILRMS
jgi:phage shock protein E